MKYDYSKIRKAGEPLKTFGGVCPGSAPLIELHQTVKEMFEGLLSANTSDEPTVGTR